jgi:hypothetical protein
MPCLGTWSPGYRLDVARSPAEVYVGVQPYPVLCSLIHTLVAAQTITPGRTLRRTPKGTPTAPASIMRGKEGREALAAGVQHGRSMLGMFLQGLICQFHKNMHPRESRAVLATLPVRSVRE